MFTPIILILCLLELEKTPINGFGSHQLLASCDLVTHLHKDSKEELRAELLDFLGQSLLVVTV